LGFIYPLSIPVRITIPDILEGSPHRLLEETLSYLEE
jgi:hypothetical protein